MTANFSMMNVVIVALLAVAAAYSLVAAIKTDLPWKRWRIAMLVASRVMLLVALAAWVLDVRLSVPRAAKKVEMIVLADRSPSISASGRKDEDAWIARAKQAMAGKGNVRVMEFGEGRATELAEALERARCAFGVGAEKRIVLLSDGRTTTGEPGIAAIKADKVSVFSVLAEPLGNESLIAELSVAPVLWRSVPSPVEVQLNASAAGTCRLTLLVDDKKTDEREVTVPRGASLVEMSVAPDGDGVHKIEVRGEFSHDTLAWNNSATALVEVPLAPRVMIVSENAAAAMQMEKALLAAGLQTKILAPAELPNEFACDCIVINNVPAASLGDPRLKAIEKFVHEGGAIVFAGGNKSYAAGGYLTTALEPAFPVMLTPDKEQPPYAMVVVLDNSWSMNEGITSSIGKINLAKEIAITAMEGLSKGDWLALVSFDSDYHNIINPTKVANLEPAKYETSRIGAFGMTNILGGLQEAARLLANIDAGYKHIVLISDGHETETGTDYSRILATLSQQHVTVSTIGVGLSPDDKLLNTLAYAGKGRYHAAKTLAEIPAVMLQEAKGMGDPLVVTAPLPAKKQHEDPALAGIDIEKMPALGGYNRAKARTHAWTPLVISRKNEPLLARMRYGRGQSLAFMSSASGAWARDWVAQNPKEYAAFWRQAVLSVLGPPFRPLSAENAARAETTRVVNGKIAGPQVDGEPEATLQLVKGAAIEARNVSRTYGREFGDPAEGRELLEKISRETGGALGSGDEAFAPPQARMTTQIDPATWLVAAMVLLLADLLLRRAPAVAALWQRHSADVPVGVK